MSCPDGQEPVRCQVDGKKAVRTVICKSEQLVDACNRRGLFCDHKQAHISKSTGTLNIHSNVCLSLKSIRTALSGVNLKALIWSVSLKARKVETTLCELRSPAWQIPRCTTTYMWSVL